jgi:SAM-dependent methyltransferase
MPDHALLVHPSANRVYARSGPALLAAELRALDELALGGRLSDIAVTELAGTPYVTFSGELDGEALAVVSNLSAVYALFERDGDRLRPVTPSRLDRWDDDLLTIQRYPGRTNEQLTRLLLDLTVAAARGSAPFTGARVRVLDPLCGRGTTMNVAVHLGFDAAGVDADRKDVEAYLHFFTTWLKDKRAKHRSQRHGVRTTLTFAADKDAVKAGLEQEVVVVADDTRKVVDHLGKGSVDVIVTDLPYGVQHGASSGGDLRRSPADLLSAALPAWRAVLRPGGAIGLAWNTKVLPRPELVRLLDAAGLAVVDGEAFDAFAHRVDQAIDRDVVVARRP